MRFSVAAARDAVGVTDSASSEQVSTSERAGYVQVRMGYGGKRPRTRSRSRARGWEAYDQHLRALRDIAGGGTTP